MKMGIAEELISKGTLAKTLSQLKTFENQKVRLEQYCTPGEIAAELLWNAYLLGDIKDKIVADIGAGTGILGIGAGIIGAKKVILIEKDKEAVQTCQQNLKKTGIRAKVVNKDVKNTNEKADTAIMNPPFGTKQEHADKEFLNKALETAKVIYSIHKTSTDMFVQQYTTKKGAKITHKWNSIINLPHSQEWHKKPKKPVEITMYRITAS